MDFLPEIDELKEDINQLIKNNCEGCMQNHNEYHTCSFEWWEINVVVFYSEAATNIEIISDALLHETTITKLIDVILFLIKNF
jgi:hypothetical protein